jgi:hypothetical protein
MRVLSSRTQDYGVACLRPLCICGDGRRDVRRLWVLGWWHSSLVPVIRTTRNKLALWPSSVVSDGVMALHTPEALMAATLVTLTLAACGINAGPYHAPESSPPGSASGTSASTGTVWVSTPPVGSVSSPTDAGAPNWRETARKEASQYSEIARLTRDGGDGRNVSVNDGGAPQLGRLPPEVIQQIVRDEYARLRGCYEEGLRRDPNLTGRVATRFVIARDGSVSQVSDGGSDLPDPVALECIFDVFRTLKFPRPDGGIITVVYPIVFSPASDSPDASVPRQPSNGRK